MPKTYKVKRDGASIRARQERLLELLAEGPLTAAELKERMGVYTAPHALLSRLLIENRVRRLPGFLYALAEAPSRVEAAADTVSEPEVASKPGYRYHKEFTDAVERLAEKYYFETGDADIRNLIKYMKGQL